jgi:hypothetical protein
MKFRFILLSAVFLLSFGGKPGHIKSAAPATHVAQTAMEDSPLLRITNNSSLKRLPLVIRDFSIALDQSTFQRDGLLNKDGFHIELRDVVSKGYETSATVAFRPDDTAYEMKLNRFNRRASDRALAVTLIHEFVHCILMDLDKRGRHGDEKALSIIERFNQKIKYTPGSCGSDFFGLMNCGGPGQHELMYQLFYQDMVLLLEQFAQIHKPAFQFREDAQDLMWSGLHATSGFLQLSLEEKIRIEIAILWEKGIAAAPWDY